MAADNSIFKVFKTKRENKNINSVFIEGQLSEAFKKRRAGQFLSIKIKEQNGWSKPHPFTISNAPADDFLRLTIKNAGPLTATMQSIPVDTEVKIAGPFGSFCSRVETQDPLMLIAGGIGITPYLSVLRHFKATNVKKNVILFWANNQAEDFFDLQELSEFVEEKIVKVVLVVLESVEPNNFLEKKGFVVENGLLTKNLFLKYSQPSSFAVYLCGSKNMQDFVVGKLQECGVDPVTIETENFGGGLTSK